MEIDWEKSTETVSKKMFQWKTAKKHLRLNANNLKV